MAKIHRNLFITGIFLVLLSTLLLFLKIPQWYCLGMPAFWFIFSFFNSRNGGESSVNLLIRHPEKFWRIYGVYLVGALLLEIVGQTVVHFWYYPPIDTRPEEVLLFLTYPFVFFSFREIYDWLQRNFRNKFVSILASTSITVILCEIPNSFVTHWIYTMPFAPISIGNLNVFALMLWPLFIVFSTFLYDEFKNFGT